LKTFIRKVFPEQKNPFKSLLLTAALCGALRVALVIIGILLITSNSLPMKISAIITFLVYPQIPDFLFLWPQLSKTFQTSQFLEEHVNWLKERQDLSPDQLRVFFRKMISFRKTASFFLWE
jgi:hypothetical protein